MSFIFSSFFFWLKYETSVYGTNVPKMTVKITINRGVSRKKLTNRFNFNDIHWGALFPGFLYKCIRENHSVWKNGESECKIKCNALWSSFLLLNDNNKRYSVCKTSWKRFDTSAIQSGQRMLQPLYMANHKLCQCYGHIYIAFIYVPRAGGEQLKGQGAFCVRAYTMQLHSGTILRTWLSTQIYTRIPHVNIYICLQVQRSIKAASIIQRLIAAREGLASPAKLINNVEHPKAHTQPCKPNLRSMIFLRYI